MIGLGSLTESQDYISLGVVDLAPAERRHSEFLRLFNCLIPRLLCTHSLLGLWVDVDLHLS